MLLILRCLLLLSAVAYIERAETTGGQSQGVPGGSQTATDRILQLVDRRDFENAELEAKKMTSVPSTSAKGYELLGYVYESCGKSSLAVEAYSKAISIAPQTLEPRVRLAILHARENNYEGCIRLLEPKRESLKADAEALFYLCQSYLHTSRTEDALSVVHMMEKNVTGDPG